MVAGAGAGDVEQMTLGVVDLLQVGVIADCFDACLQRNDLVVASHDGHGAKFEPLRTKVDRELEEVKKDVGPDAVLDRIEENSA